VSSRQPSHCVRRSVLYVSAKRESLQASVFYTCQRRVTPQRPCSCRRKCARAGTAEAARAPMRKKNAGEPSHSFAIPATNLVTRDYFPNWDVLAMTQTQHDQRLRRRWRGGSEAARAPCLCHMLKLYRLQLHCVHSRDMSSAQPHLTQPSAAYRLPRRSPPCRHGLASHIACVWP
jgi:hypothetical protein